MLRLKIQRFLPDKQEPTTSPPCQFYLSFRPSRHLFSMDMYFRNTYVVPLWLSSSRRVAGAERSSFGGKLCLCAGVQLLLYGGHAWLAAA